MTQRGGEAVGDNGHSPANPAAERAERTALLKAEDSIALVSPRMDAERRVALVTSIRDLGRFAAETARASLTDPLTGLPNLRALEHDLIHFGIHGFIQEAAALADGAIDGEILEVDGVKIPEQNRRREPANRLSVIYIDFDNFKAGNDALGHDLMDQLLVEITVYMSRLFRSSDVLYRVGGDEFVYLMPEGTDEEAIGIFETQLDGFIAELHARYPYLQRIGFGASRGIIKFDPLVHKNFAGIKRSAELAMYDDKQRKRAARPAPQPRFSDEQ